MIDVSDISESFFDYNQPWYLCKYDHFTRDGVYDVTKAFTLYLVLYVIDVHY